MIRMFSDTSPWIIHSQGSPKNEGELYFRRLNIIRIVKPRKIDLKIQGLNFPSGIDF